VQKEGLEDSTLDDVSRVMKSKRYLMNEVVAEKKT
jgi:hypothetical protein